MFTVEEIEHARQVLNAINIKGFARDIGCDYAKLRAFAKGQKSDLNLVKQVIEHLKG
jgi:hypothetical protein